MKAKEKRVKVKHEWWTARPFVSSRGDVWIEWNAVDDFGLRVMRVPRRDLCIGDQIELLAIADAAATLNARAARIVDRHLGRLEAKAARKAARKKRLTSATT